jgi:hypothetical protein
MTRQMGPQGNAIVSKYLVSPIASLGYFTTITEAIAAAVVDGASSATPLTVYIKDGTFIEDFTIPDGINLVGCAELYSPVIIGTITQTSGTASLQNLIIRPASGNNAFNLQAGILSITDSVVTCVNSTAFACATTGTRQFYIYDSTVTGDGTSSFITSDGTAGSTTVRTTLSTVTFPNASSIYAGPLGALSISYDSSIIRHCISVQCATVSISAFYGRLNQSTGSFFSFDSSTSTLTSGLAFRYCSMDNSSGSVVPFLVFTSANLAMEISHCITGPGFTTANLPTTFTAQTVLAYNLKDVEGTLGFSIDSFTRRIGFQGSDYTTNQGWVQTTDATVTTVDSFVLNEGEAVTVKGTVTGAQSNQTNAVGGDFLLEARRQSGGNITLIGVPIVNVNSSSAATFTVDVDVATQSIRVRVTGVAAITYNWTTTYSYQKMLTNS